MYLRSESIIDSGILPRCRSASNTHVKATWFQLHHRVLKFEAWRFQGVQVGDLVASTVKKGNRLNNRHNFFALL
ncbi:hypothetical protein ABKN59_001850 [Abortiporus biennis]